MKVTIFQRDITWANPEKNALDTDKFFEQQVQGTDLVILPEMFSTGFCTDPKDIAESDGFSLVWMLEKARTYDCAIAGSVATEEDGKYYNRLYFVYPDGRVELYDKHHLFTFAGEDKNYTAGQERKIVEYKGFRFLLEICYDLRFPVWARNSSDYDAIIYVASWPTPRIQAWNTLLRARAIENQCYVIGVNRVGEDPSCSYCGGSAIIDAYGNAIAECEWEKESWASADLSMEELEKFRTQFPVLNDADRFKLF